MKVKNMFYSREFDFDQSPRLSQKEIKFSYRGYEEKNSSEKKSKDKAKKKDYSQERKQKRGE